ncbi:MAG: hypothetical protein ACYTF7_10605 [Planctomycetota bacterium]|jgi:hypothetical protein
MRPLIDSFPGEARPVQLGAGSIGHRAEWIQAARFFMTGRYSHSRRSVFAIRRDVEDALMGWQNGTIQWGR